MKLNRKYIWLEMVQSLWFESESGLRLYINIWIRIRIQKPLCLEFLSSLVFCGFSYRISAKFNRVPVIFLINAGAPAGAVNDSEPQQHRFIYPIYSGYSSWFYSLYTAAIVPGSTLCIQRL